MIAAQLSFAVEPEPIGRRQKQRDAERAIAIDKVASNAIMQGIFDLADRVVDSVIAQYGGVTSVRLRLAMEAAGYGEAMGAVDKRWTAGYLCNARGWKTTGERVSEGSHSRKIEVWVRAAERGGV